MIEYECSNGHEQYSEVPLEHCLHCVHGQPCNGILWRFGSGAVAANKALAAERGLPIPDGLPGAKNKVSVG